MFGVAAVSLAQLVATSAEAAPPAVNAPAFTLAEARATWAETLAHNDYREDAPAMRALAETLAPQLIALWRASMSDSDLRSQVIELMNATAADGLRPLLRESRLVAELIGASWLRWHDDPDVVPLTEAAPRMLAVRSLAMHRPERAIAPLIRWFGDSDVHTRNGACDAALLLPVADRRRVLDAVLPQLTSIAPADNWPACIRLVVDHPVGRRWLQAAVLSPANAPRTNGPERWPALATTLLVASGPVDPRVSATLARWTTFLSTQAEGPFRRELVTALEIQSARWPATSPARRPAVLALLHATGTEGVRLWPLRRSLGDPLLFRDAVHAMASPSLQPPTWAVALRVVGLTAPLDPIGRAEAIDALDLLRSRLRSWAIDTVSPRDIERWRSAIMDVRPCAPAACAALLERADDPHAARILALGAPLEDAEVARVVVRRVATAGEEFAGPDVRLPAPSALAAVALSSVTRCAPSLRGLAFARPTTRIDSHGHALDPWRERLSGWCSTDTRRP